MSYHLFLHSKLLNKKLTYVFYSVKINMNLWRGNIKTVYLARHGGAYLQSHLFTRQILGESQFKYRPGKISETHPPCPTNKLGVV
jgi:hypothetical protein